jgi:hypothetical protein
VAERRPFLLRIDPALFEVLQRWANDEVRSLNGQVEYLLTRAVREAGRLRAGDRSQNPEARIQKPEDRR